MSNPVTWCDPCYATSVEQCEDLTFPVGLTPATNYIAVVTSHKGQRYTQTVTADAGGAVTLDNSGFPEGFFNPYGGFYTLEITSVAGIAQTLTIAYSTWGCVSFDIYDSTDANP